jgi:membrane protein DedA with SNARE-associated domain
MADWFYGLLSQLTYVINLENLGVLGILFALGLASEIGLPLFFGVEAFLFFMSYQASPLSGPVLLIVLMLMVGRQCGAAVIYWLSALLGSRLLEWLCRHFPGLRAKLDKARARLQKQTILQVTLVRLTPGLLQVPSLITGIMRLSYLDFAAGVAISSLIYDFAFILFGYLARIGLTGVEQETAFYLTVGFLGVTAVAIFLVSLRRDRKVHKRG